MTMTKAAANRLWNKLEKNLFEFESTLKQIIAEKAWEPLGYDGFSQAWADKMSHIKVSSLLLPHILYQMFDENLSDTEVSDIVAGIGEPTARLVRRQKRNNVPADCAVVREHHRRKAGAATHLKIEVGKGNPERFRMIARKAGLSVEEIAIPALEFAFNQIESSML